MPGLHQYRIFISHAWGYSAAYNRLINYLNDAPNFRYANYSVPRPKGFDRMSINDLKEELRQQIRPVEVFVVLSGMYVAHSGWLQFEMDFADYLDKPILGVRPWGQERIPTAVSNAADLMVGWNTPTIVSAIRRLA